MSDEAIRQHAAAGVTRAVHPTAARHFRAILEQVDGACPTELTECPGVGALDYLSKSKVTTAEYLSVDLSCLGETQ